MNNLAPPVDAGAGGEIDEGGTFVSAGSFTDPGAADSWSATVDYGDGSEIQWLELSGMNFHFSHEYTGHQCDPFTVTVTVTDDRGAEGSGTTGVRLSTTSMSLRSSRPT